MHVDVTDTPSVCLVSSANNELVKWAPFITIHTIQSFTYGTHSGQGLVRCTVTCHIVKSHSFVKSTVPYMSTPQQVLNTEDSTPRELSQLCITVEYRQFGTQRCSGVTWDEWPASAETPR
jgi:hypothetical protein